ncbi:MAG: hypothetical protein J1E40_06500 [Oscillospiraceae bacterium]|nr:hypothetical protein [Oscillospiraceae bacterium]
MEKAILQNLIDAGCDEKTITSFGSCKSVKDEIRLLEKHRVTLLDKSHAVNRQIACLDYLVYNLEKENEKI